ncbi:Synaptobrevin, putative [Entamoeba histolytica]
MFPTVVRSPYFENQKDRIKKQLEETRNTMAKNVEMMTQNIATAEELEVQSNEMSINAQQFKKQAIVLRKTYWWKNFKLWLLIIISLILILCLIGGIVTLAVINLK